MSLRCYALRSSIFRFIDVFEMFSSPTWPASRSLSATDDVTWLAYSFSCSTGTFMPLHQGIDQFVRCHCAWDVSTPPRTISRFVYQGGICERAGLCNLLFNEHAHAATRIDILIPRSLMYLRCFIPSLVDYTHTRLMEVVTRADVIASPLCYILRCCYSNSWTNFGNVTVFGGFQHRPDRPTYTFSALEYLTRLACTFSYSFRTTTLWSGRPFRPTTLYSSTASLSLVVVQSPAVAARDVSIPGLLMCLRCFSTDHPDETDVYPIDGMARDEFVRSHFS